MLFFLLFSIHLSLYYSKIQYLNVIGKKNSIKVNILQEKSEIKIIYSYGEMCESHKVTMKGMLRGKIQDENLIWMPNL